jgi:hypothetical protein
MKQYTDLPPYKQSHQACLQDIDLLWYGHTLTPEEYLRAILLRSGETMTTGIYGQVINATLNGLPPTTATTSEGGFERLVTKGELIADMSGRETQIDNKLAWLELQVTKLPHQQKCDSQANEPDGGPENHASAISLGGRFCAGAHSRCS